ncbi:MAG: S8 family serine peptidase [bacterium]|nr:S8 family serine peptidase [bacterium]
MKRQRHLHLFLLIVVLSVCSVLHLDARTLPGLDGYVVDMPARTLSNGMAQPARRFVMSRPATNTIQPGVVYVLTKKTYGMIKGDRTLSNSSVNIDLQGLKVKDISLAMSPTSATDVRSQEAIASGLDRLYVIRYDEALDPFDLCKRLMNNPDVEYAAPARIHQLSFTPNDPRLGQQSYLNKIKVPQAWDVTKGSSDILIAIIDTGVDWMHEDLAANIWTNPGEIAGNNIDDDNNGYIDDVRGWDFVGNVSPAEAQSGILRPDADPRQLGSSWTDGQAHGTVVAGNAAAVTNNAKGVSGIASNCKILAIKVASDNPGQTGIIEGYTAIRYAADMGADVINCSWGGYGADPAAQTFIDYAISKGAVVVAAAGNNGVNMNNNPHAPASLDGVLSVGSVNGSDQPSWFSNYGYANTTYAPGENPLSTFPGNQYKGLSGTSFSSPVVAGVVALVRSVHPDWTPAQVIMQIRMTNDPVAGVTGANKPLYFGRINAERAVKVNASFTSGERVPGIGLTSISVDGGQKITSFTEATIRLDFSNALADAQDVIVSVQISDPNIELLSAPDINVGDMPRNGTANATVRVRLKPGYPWFKGLLNVGLNLRSAITSNFAFVSIPVELQTTNTYTGSGPVEGITFTQATITTDQTVWGTGPLGGVGFLIRGAGATSSSFTYLPVVPTALDAISATVGVIGSSDATSATILTTNNGGSSWSPVVVTGFAKTVDAAKLYDANNGLFIGTGASTKFAIGRTSNGGSTWTQSVGAPQMSAGEQVARGTAYFYKGNSWFGTTNGRVLRSTNRGDIWTAANLSLGAGVIESIAFRDSVNGVLLYRTGAALDSPKRIASSTNGGASWTKNVFDPATLGINATFVTSPSENHVALVGSFGEVFGSDNEGTSWQTILSQASGNVMMGKGLKIQGQHAVLFAGSQLGVLTYRYSGPNAVRTLIFSVQTTDFGTVNVGQSRQKFIKVVNPGEGDVTIDTVIIIPDNGAQAGGFVVSVPLSPTILGSDDDQFGVRFSSSDSGSFGATILVVSDATTDTIRTRVTAYSQAVTDVAEEGQHNLSVWPNPAQDILNVSVDASVNSITIVDARGTVVASVVLAQDAAHVPHRLDIRNLASGAYRVRVASLSGVQSIPLIISR